VFAEIARAYPDAPIFTSIYDERAVGDLFPAERVRVSFMQRLPFVMRAFRAYAPLYPRAFDGLDLRGYDLVVSSTSAWAKGVRVPPGATHVCYIHNVSRFVVSYDAYVGGLGAGRYARFAVDRLVAWDRRAALRPTAYVSNSRVVADRVRRYYGRDARVLNPPIDLTRFEIGAGDGGYDLIVSRLLPYKRVDLAIAACAALGRKLVVVGKGPSEKGLRRIARGTSTEFAGAVDDATAARLMRGARVVLLPGEEDFGLVPLEANACGRPVVAYRGGGALETTIEGVTGEFFDEATPASLAATLARFDANAYDPHALRAHAENFRPELFRERLRAIVGETVATQAQRSD
jgi:glycosyltransferase involved in cell wall biosynthesis